MIKYEVDEEVLAADIQVKLLAEEHETGSQLQQELTDMGHESSLDFPLLGFSGRCEELEVVGVLQQLAG
jgi:hypothetical protein